MSFVDPCRCYDKTEQVRSWDLLCWIGGSLVASAGIRAASGPHSASPDAPAAGAIVWTLRTPCRIAKQETDSETISAYVLQNKVRTNYTCA